MAGKARCITPGKCKCPMCLRRWSNWTQARCKVSCAKVALCKEPHCGCCPCYLHRPLAQAERARTRDRFRITLKDRGVSEVRLSRGLGSMTVRGRWLMLCMCRTCTHMPRSARPGASRYARSMTMSWWETRSSPAAQGLPDGVLDDSLRVIVSGEGPDGGRLVHLARAWSGPERADTRLRYLFPDLYAPVRQLPPRFAEHRCGSDGRCLARPCCIRARQRRSVTTGGNWR